jgi:VanZ family protein
MVRKNILSIIIALVIIFLSFTGPGTFSKLNIPKIPNLDKLVHMSMYFTFMFALIIDNRARLSTTKSYLMLALLPVLFGATIEILQSLLTKYRTGDFFDACYNLFGVLLALFAWKLFIYLKEKRHT